MSSGRDEHDDEADGAQGTGAGYATAQLLRAMAQARDHADPDVRARAQQRAQRWRRMLLDMAAGKVSHGSRAPIAATPAWLTPEVMHGGFASGALKAGGELSPHELALAGELRATKAQARAVINAWYLGEAGLAALTAQWRDGRYRIDVPEQGALLVVAALRAHGRIDAATELTATIAPYFERVRFYPEPADAAAPDDGRVSVRDAGWVAAALERKRPQPRVRAQQEAAAVWLPHHDRVVAMFLETVEDGWPCRRYPADWAQRARALADDYESLRERHALCAGRSRERRHPAQLRRLLARCARDPAALDGRDVGRIRMMLQRYLDKRGAPQSPACRAQRERQRADVAGADPCAIGHAVAARLRARPQDRGVDDLDPILAPLDAAEAARFGVPAQAAVPEAVRRRAQRCLHADVRELAQRGLVGSAEELARLLPQVAAVGLAEGLADAPLRRLYAAIYRAFRRRRSLLLVNLAHQVRIGELPWVAALDCLRHGDRIPREARADLADAAELALTRFARSTVPNKLVGELDAMARSAGLELPLTEEVAADIFMHAFAPKYVRAAKFAAQAMRGTLYARYYDIDSERVLALPEDTTALARLCAERAGDAGRAGRRAAANGQVIEQQQILTTHNLAALYAGLGLADRIGAGHAELAGRCLRWIVARQRNLAPARHPRLIAIKQCAYAWRQMLFFLSHAPAAEQHRFVAEVERRFAELPRALRARFDPVARGLALAVRGERLDQRTLDRGGAQRFLGWCVGAHPQME